MQLTDQSRLLEQRLNAIPADILAALRPALLRSAQDVAGNMRALAEGSRDTGDLIDSIEVTGPGEITPAYTVGGGMRTAKPNEALVTVGNETMRHGHLVEFGTATTEAQPFMIPGFRIARPKIIPRLARAIKAAIKKAGRT